MGNRPIMKNPGLLLITVLALFAISSCNKHSSEAAKKISELERQNKAAVDRQRELEQQLEDQKLAVERDAIERDRAKIEEDRAALEQQQGEAAAANDEAIRVREEALARREGKLEQLQSSLEEKQDGFEQRDQQLNEKERDLAGREALPFEQPEQAAPAADYGVFYESLSPYGSWFQTVDYGYVWQPAAVRDSNWRPYARGRWVCSDRGWNWVSEEPFGWATYHYGRWALLHGHGWIWVPGSEWAPCWVSWRENDTHIGWAPLPPETLAYRGHSWDSTVDVQFRIGASCFNFVEIRHFGSPIHGHCLPASGNITIFAQTVNITYIHIHNRQIICGGPRYRQVSDRIGRPMPFYRLQVDQHPRGRRDPLAMRPRIQDGRLVVSAPNIDSHPNDSPRPERIKRNLERVSVERDGELSDEITNRYRQSREEEIQKAGIPNEKSGVREKADPPRVVQAQETRQPTEPRTRVEVPREWVENPDKKVVPAAEDSVRQPHADRNPLANRNDQETSVTSDGPRAISEENPNRPLKPPGQSQPDGPRDTPKPDPGQAQSADTRQQEAMQREQQRQAEKAALIQAEKEQARQQAMREKQIQAEEARKQAIEQQREQEALQRQQQAEAQRQREQARQQQMEESRREQARQQQQEAQRQQEARRQQEAQKQQESARQQQQKEENERKRSRNP